MEQNQNPFPEINVLPRLQAIGEGIARFLRAGSVTEACLSEHKTGAAEMLDQLTFDYPDKKPDAGLEG